MTSMKPAGTFLAPMSPRMAASTDSASAASSLSAPALEGWFVKRLGASMTSNAGQMVTEKRFRRH
jgi:hypothetical protein